MLGPRGIGGVRNSLVSRGGFVPEAVEEWSDRSLHILNYNSPGATGAPAFSAQLVSRLIEKGYLEGAKREPSHGHIWSFSAATALD
jgi:L-2-hydroxyglutarate oxidase